MFKENKIQIRFIHVNSRNTEHLQHRKFLRIEEIILNEKEVSEKEVSEKEVHENEVNVKEWNKLFYLSTL